MSLFACCKLIVQVTLQSLQSRGTVHTSYFNPFPYDKILDHTKLKAFADDKLNVTKMIISVFDRVENIVGKGEIACTNNFSFSLNVFKRPLSFTHQKVSLCWNGLNGISFFISICNSVSYNACSKFKCL